MQKSLKAPLALRSNKSTDDRDWPICCSLLDAESTGFGPKRLLCSVRPFNILNRTGVSKWSCAHVCTSHLVTVPAGYSFYSVPVTGVEPWCES